jgi:glycosyltransferase involved in cell wall biosynthesis
MKGIEEVIKAFSFIIKEQPNAKLWVIGKGEEAYIRQLKQMAEEYRVADHVIFWGAVQEEKKFTLMSRAHMLLHASVKEGWGLVVLEAAYSGTPSIVYPVPGLCDVVKNKKTGIVLSENSPRMMAREAIRLYIDKDTYAYYQKNGKLWAGSLKWKDVAQKSLSILKKALL